MLLSLLVGDVFFLSLVMFAGGTFGAPLPILLFPQLAAGGLDPAHADGVLPRGLRVDCRCSGSTPIARIEGTVGAAQVFQTGIIGFGFFATVGIAVALGRYTKQSEDLAAQRGIDVANLEQVNRLIIQDMQDGVLVVDLNGVVRGHNAQVTRLLGGFGRMRGGMRLAEFSARCTTTGGAGRRTSPRRCRRSRSRPRSACCACAWCASAPGSTAARSSISRTSAARRRRRSR